MSVYIQTSRLSMSVYRPYFSSSCGCRLVWWFLLTAGALWTYHSSLSTLDGYRPQARSMPSKFRESCMWTVHGPSGSLSGLTGPCNTCTKCDGWTLPQAKWSCCTYNTEINSHVITCQGTFNNTDEQYTNHYIYMWISRNHGFTHPQETMHQPNLLATLAGPRQRKPICKKSYWKN